MNTTSDRFTKQLSDNTEAVEDRAKSLKKYMHSAVKKSQSKVRSKPDKVKLKLGAKKQKIDKSQAKLKTQPEEKEPDIKMNGSEWKASREPKSIENFADRAEDYAATALLLVMTMMEEAEEATLSAICTRLDAESAKRTSTIA